MLAAAPASSVADLTISHYKGYENRELDYYGDLPDGTYKIYAQPTDYRLKKAAKEAERFLTAMRDDVDYNGDYRAVLLNLRDALEGK
jgi:hypothetical protein